MRLYNYIVSFCSEMKLYFTYMLTISLNNSSLLWTTKEHAYTTIQIILQLIPLSAI